VAWKPEDRETLDDDSIIFESEVAGTDEIKFWIMSWDSNAQVLKPESLKDEIRAEAEAMLDKSGEDTEK